MIVRFLYDEVDSTNTQAERLLLDDNEAPFAVIANRQTNGRGQRGSIWHSHDAGNLYLSVMLPGVDFAADLSQLPIYIARQFCEDILLYYGVHLTVKYPNDIFFDGKKLGGILLETKVAGEEVFQIICGIGINISSCPVLEKNCYQAISLSEIVTGEIDKNQICNLLINSIIDGYAAIVNQQKTKLM